MNNWPNVVITTQGLDMQSKLLSGDTLKITKVVSSSGTVPAAQLASQTNVTTPQQVMTIQSLLYPEPGKAALTALLTNDSVTTGYTCRQIGVFAENAAGEEILFFIAQATTGTVVPSATEMPGFSAVWTFYFQYGQADGVSVTVDPSNTVTSADVQNLISAALQGYLALTGGNMTGNIGYNSGVRTGDIIRFISGDANGSGIAIGDGGTTVIGGGESAKLYEPEAGSGSAEQLILANDTDIKFYVNCQSGADSANLISLNRDGTITAAGFNGAQKAISYGTAAPSGGVNGDIYIQY